VRLLEEGRRLAVLAVDPSSPLSRGSILGDKTRMPRLAADPRAFVRPSPAGSSIGGVTHGTREAIILLEAAGHDVVLVETVGVGQSELAVRGMVDFFLLLVQPGSGDELQGLKRGVVEIADAVVVTKADGDNLARAERTRADYAGALRYLAPAEAGWEPPVLTCSALSGAGLGAIWDAVRRHRELGEQSGALARRRHEQAVEGLRAAVAEQLAARFHALPPVAALYPALEKEVGEGRLLPGAAARRLLEAGDQ